MPKIDASSSIGAHNYLIACLEKLRLWFPQGNEKLLMGKLVGRKIKS